jgi:hypothetical protein
MSKRTINIPIDWLNLRFEIILHRRWEPQSKDRTYLKHHWPPNSWNVCFGAKTYKSIAKEGFVHEPKTLMLYFEINPVFEIVLAITRHYISETKHSNENPI